MFRLFAFASMAAATLAVSPVAAATFYTTNVDASHQQTAFTAVIVGGQEETQTTIAITNQAAFGQDLGFSWVRRVLSGINAPWNQADLAFETGNSYAKPDTSTFYAYDPTDTDVVPPADSGYQLGDSIDFFDFGTFAPGETKQQTLVFLVSSNLTSISGLAYVVGAISAVPEPTSWAMFIGGFGAIGFCMRRRRIGISLA